jgi:hypothetical protein
VKNYSGVVMEDPESEEDRLALEPMGTRKKYKESKAERAILLPNLQEWETLNSKARNALYAELEPELNELGRRERAPVGEPWSFKTIGQWFWNERARRARSGD